MLYCSRRRGQRSGCKVNPLNHAATCNLNIKIAACLDWCAVVQAFQNPVIVIAISELDERGLSVRCRVKMKAKSRLTLRKQWLLIPVSILMGIGMWYYFDRVGVAAQVSKDAAENSPRGNLSDLYPP